MSACLGRGPGAERSRATLASRNAPRYHNHYDNIQHARYDCRSDRYYLHPVQCWQHRERYLWGIDEINFHSLVNLIISLVVTSRFLKPFIKLMLKSGICYDENKTRGVYTLD